MFTITVHRSRGAGEPERQVEHRAQVVLELAGHRAVLGPVAGVVRAHRQLVDQDPAVAWSRTARRPARRSRRAPWRSCSATCWACVGQRRVEVRAPGRRPRGRCRRAGCWPRPGTPPPGRSGCAPPAPRARAGSRPAPRPAAGTPVRRGGRERAPRTRRPSATNQTPLPSYPPRVVLRTHGKPNASTSSTVGHDGVARARARRARPAGPASPPCPGRAPAPRARAGSRRRRPASACRCSVGTCSWSKVTTCAPVVTFRSISRSV